MPTLARLTAAGSALAWAGAALVALNRRHLARPEPLLSHGADTVPVLVPARDEAGRIDACVRSIVGQDAVAEVVVLDDGSTDATADLARAAGARVIAGSPPGPGWLGKPWACAQLYRATPPSHEFLVFLDADVVLEPGAVSAAVALAGQTGADLLYPFPRQLAVTPAERLVQPLLQWSWLTTVPLRVAQDSTRASLAVACGQFVVVRRPALDRVGGFAVARGAVLDDLALARAIKAAGGRVVIADGSRLAQVRMYDGWPALRDGYGKSLWSAFGSPAGAAVALAGLGVTYVLPPLAAVHGSRVGLLGYLGAVASRVLAARATGARAWPDALAHPISVGAFGWLTVRSVREHRRGRLTWKGRPIRPV